MSLTIPSSVRRFKILVFTVCALGVGSGCEGEQLSVKKLVVDGSGMSIQHSPNAMDSGAGVNDNLQPPGVIQANSSDGSILLIDTNREENISFSPNCPCTRRTKSFQCQPGVNKVVEVIIDGAGSGEVTLEGTPSTIGTSFDLNFAMNAVNAPTTIKVTELNLAAPAWYVDYSPLYLIEPNGISFLSPVKIRLPTANSLPSVSRALSVYWGATSDGPFERLPDSYINAGFLQATLPGTGYVFAGYLKAGENLACP